MLTGNLFAIYGISALLDSNYCPRRDVFPRKMRHRKTPNLPRSDLKFHQMANFRVGMRERDQSNRILH